MTDRDTFSSAYIIDEKHPNSRRWQRAVDTALLRGRIAAGMLESDCDLKGKRILDIGAGVGGTAVVLRDLGAEVTAVDRNPERVAAILALPGGIDARTADAGDLPFTAGSFDAVILQDVIEHCIDAASVLREIRRVLRPGGLAYLSTPNRHSPINVLADPHWGLPLLTLLNETALRRVLRIVRPADADRDDLARLFSFDRLHGILRETGFSISLRTKQIAAAFAQSPRSVVWSRLHLSIAAFMKAAGLHHMLVRVANDKPGFLNRYITPSWHIICRKGTP